MNAAFGIRNEVFIQHGVVSTDASVRPLFVIMIEPHAKDVVELTSTEAEEVIQHFSLRRSDKAFTERVCFWGSRRRANTSHIRFPEVVEFVRILSVAISYEKARSDPLVRHPHRSITRLLQYPLGIRMIGAWTAKDLSATQMDKDKYIRRRECRRA